MKLLLVGIVCMLVGMFLGAATIALGENIAVDAVVECIKTPDSCGMEDDDLDPQQKLVPAGIPI
jgi:hypothetical protein